METSTLGTSMGYFLMGWEDIPGQMEQSMRVDGREAR